MLFVLLPFGGVLLKVNFFLKKNSKKVLADDLISESKKNDDTSTVYSGKNFR
jgi:hypothetical protein